METQTIILLQEDVMISFTRSRIPILFSALLVMVGSILFTLAPVSNVSASALGTENIIEKNLIETNEVLYFDKDNAINDGLSLEEATLLDEIYNGTGNNSEEVSDGGISTMALPLLVIPLLAYLPAGAVSAIKGAAFGGAAVVAGAFALDLYNAGVYTACENHYGKVGVLDNFCDGKGYSF